jgi:hypothetical protein
MEPHDCVISRLVAGRPKDKEFAAALLEAGIVTGRVLVERLPDVEGLDRQASARIEQWLRRQPASG